MPACSKFSPSDYENTICETCHELQRYHTMPLNLTPGDMLETRQRLYHVSGVHLGALGQESIVELVPLDATRPDANGKIEHPLVPLHMLELLALHKEITVSHG